MIKDVDVQVRYASVLSMAEKMGIEKLTISTINDTYGRRKLLFIDTKQRKIAYTYVGFTSGMERDFFQVGYFKNASGDLRSMVKGMQAWYGYELINWSDFYDMEIEAKNDKMGISRSRLS